MTRSDDARRGPLTALALLPASFLAAALAVGTAGAQTAVSRTYTLNADFDAGSLYDVTHDPVPDQLQIPRVPKPYPYIWVAASGRDTVVKIDTNTGIVLGEYRSGPDGTLRDPSRVSVDREGNVWAGNRNSALITGLVGEDGRPFVEHDGTVIKIGLLEAGQCVDRNGNGMIDTSTGLGDVKPWPNPGGVDTFGGVSSAEDECILIFKRIDGPNPRQTSVDLEGDVWVGGDALAARMETKLQLLDGQTGDIVRTIDLNDPADSGEPGPLFTDVFAATYGGSVDCNGVLWSAGNFSNILIRIDPAFPNGHPDLVTPIQLDRTSYGISIAADGTLWHSNFLVNTIMQFDGAGNVIGGPYPTTTFAARGIAANPVDGHVWVAATESHGVTRHDPVTGAILAKFPTGQFPTGVAIDSNGKVWVTHLGDGTVTRVDPAIDAVDLTIDLDFTGHPTRDEARPYNYSDMTGIFSLLTRPFGRWTVTTEGECDQTTWSRVSWTGSEPAGSSLDVEARAADTPAALQAATFQAVTNGALLSGLVGRLIETRVNFRTEVGHGCLSGTTPILFDLTVEGDDVTPPSIACEPDRAIDCTQAVPADPPRATDNCGAPTVTTDEIRIDGPCPQTYRLERTHRAVDLAGQVATCVQAIVVSDTTGPTFDQTPAPGPLTFDCEAVPAPERPQAIDDCDPAPIVRFDETRTDGPCPHSYTLLRRWEAEDACGNPGQVAVQELRVTDGSAPTLQGVPDDETVACQLVPPPATPTASDLCDPAPSVAFQETRVDGGCPDSYTLVRRWTATDACGNAVTETQEVDVVDDSAPRIDGVPGDDTFECDGVPAPVTPTAFDECDPAPAITFQETRAGSCPEIITRTWTATDRCGNTATATRVLTVDDTLAPTLTGVPANERIQCDEPLPAPPPVGADDACDPAPTVELTTEQRPGSCPDHFFVTRTWTATDACGNQARAMQVIEVVDTVPPIVAAALAPLAPASSASAQSAASAGSPCSAPSDGTFIVECSATDNCDPSPVLDATLRTVRHVIDPFTGDCDRLVELIPVTCGETITLALAAPPCPASSPTSAGDSQPVNSDGTLVITAESVTLEVAATDRCGNVGQTSLDPTQPTCPDPTPDCCPAIVAPTADCDDPCGVSRAPIPTRGLSRAPAGRHHDRLRLRR